MSIAHVLAVTGTRAVTVEIVRSETQVSVAAVQFSSMYDGTTAAAFVGSLQCSLSHCAAPDTCPASPTGIGFSPCTVVRRISRRWPE